VVRYLIWAMEGRGEMSNNAIYRAFKAVCADHRHEPYWQEEVRQTLQAHCRSAGQWNERDDFFEHPRRGYWSCKVKSPTLEQL
jgi:hypothetical protein